MSNEIDFWTEAKAVANFFIEKSDPQDPDRYVDILKLNKLLYFSFGWATVFLPERELFVEEIQAWKFGPVVPSIYTEFKDFKYNPINKKASDFDPENNNFDIPEINIKQKELVIFLNNIWNTYGKLGASRLVTLTHEAGSPWQKSYKEGIKFTVIPRDEIKEYFNKKKQNVIEK